MPGFSCGLLMAESLPRVKLIFKKQIIQKAFVNRLAAFGKSNT